MMVYLTERKVKFFALSFTLFIFVCGIFAILFYFALLPSQLDPQGEASSDCIKKELPTKSNGAGMIVSAHQTLCKEEEDSSTFYVHLRKQGTPENSESLIFRYADQAHAPAPEIKWAGDSLLISVGKIRHVSALTTLKDEIKIHYNIEKEDDEWARGNPERWSPVEASVFLFFVLILLIMGSYKVIKRIRKFLSEDKPVV